MEENLSQSNFEVNPPELVPEKCRVCGYGELYYHFRYGLVCDTCAIVHDFSTGELLDSTDLLLLQFAYEIEKGDEW